MAAAALALPHRATAKTSANPPHVLLVCQFGTVKSAIARELLKRRAAQRGVTLSVESRGITPQHHLPSELEQRLAADGINPAAEPLRQLQARDIAAADLVIGFDKLPSQFRPRRLLDWSDLPSMVNDYAKSRVILDARIDSLLDSLRSAR